MGMSHVISSYSIMCHSQLSQKIALGQEKLSASYLPLPYLKILCILKFFEAVSCPNIEKNWKCHYKISLQNIFFCLPTLTNYLQHEVGRKDFSFFRSYPVGCVGVTYTPKPLKIPLNGTIYFGLKFLKKITISSLYFDMFLSIQMQMIFL